MATSRSYEDSCGVAHGLDLVGERWALLIARELMLGSKRFSDLKADLPGISSNVLSHRLDELEQAGVVGRRRLPRPAASWVYELSDWGRELEAVMQVLGRWAARSTTHRRDLHFGVTSLILSLRTNFDAALAGDARLTVGVRCGDDDEYVAVVAHGDLTVEAGDASSAEAVVVGEPPMIASVVYAGRPLAAAIADGDLVVTGSVDIAARFLGMYSLPEPAPPPAISRVTGVGPQA